MATHLERPATIDEERLLDYALSYARHGWPVAPMYEVLADGQCACNSEQCPHVGRHARVPDASYATTDEEQIRRWWRIAPGAGIGVAMKLRDGPVVIMPIPGTMVRSAGKPRSRQTSHP
jgi:hypothetical protein